MAEIEQQCTEIKLSVPWGHIAAKTYGSSAGEPVLLVHGRLDNLGTFTRLMKYLPKELFYYVCIDLPGHGLSSHFPPWMLLDTMDYGHSLHFILEALKWKTCIYIGHSMGAQLGLLFSTFQPNRIKKLISLDGMLINKEGELVSYFKTASALSIKVYNDRKSLSLTKEEVLHALKTKRISTLSSEAAEAIFERAVTKVNGKYVYNRDKRLGNHPFSSLKIDELERFNSKLSIPIYVFAPTHGLIVAHKEYPSIYEMIKAKTMLEVINIDGNHDVHNNYPERVAPFICKILNSNNSSKL